METDPPPLMSGNENSHTPHGDLKLPCPAKTKNQAQPVTKALDVGTTQWNQSAGGQTLSPKRSLGDSHSNERIPGSNEQLTPGSNEQLIPGSNEHTTTHHIPTQVQTPFDTWTSHQHDLTHEVIDPHPTTRPMC